MVDITGEHRDPMVDSGERGDSLVDSNERKDLEVASGEHREPTVHLVGPDIFSSTYAQGNK